MIDFRLSESQVLLQRSVRAALREHSPIAAVRRWEESPEGFDLAVYRELARLGWIGLLVPEALGGQGEGWIEATVLYEENGHTLYPSPLYGAIVAARLLARFAGPEQQALIEPILSGDVTIAPAFWERSAKTSLRALETTARRDGSAYVIEGEKRAVEFGHSVDQLLVAVAVESGGVALALVDRAADGVKASRIASLGGEPRSLVRLAGVRVLVERVIPLADADLAEFERILLHLRLLRAAELIGVAAAALDLAISYAGQRVQYGRPIGAFQAIQHKLSTCAMRVEVARGPVAYAAWLLSEGQPADAAVAEAVLKSGEMAQFVTAESVQTHGGLGIVEDSDVSLYFRRAKARQTELGTPDYLRERIATELLG